MRPDLQLKVVFITLFVTSLSLIINSQLVLRGTWQLSHELGGQQPVSQVMQLLQDVTMRSLFLSIVIAVPFTIVFGVAYSFRFAGPVIGIQNFLRELRAGRWDSRCKLREKDDLHDIAELLNECLDPMRARMLADQATLRQVEHLLTNAVFEGDATSQQAIVDILQRIQVSRDEVSERLPDDQPEMLVTDPVRASRQPVAEEAPSPVPARTAKA